MQPIVRPSADSIPPLNKRCVEAPGYSRRTSSARSDPRKSPMNTRATGNLIFGEDSPSMFRSDGGSPAAYSQLLSTSTSTVKQKRSSIAQMKGRRFLYRSFLIE